MLVSIIVITYNSSRFVLETLESAYRQTHQDIELIISDDCSTDDTFYICQQWIETHKNRYVRAICTQTPHNGGICWNYNHALKLAHGEWIKYIAGDDILQDNCIERYVANIKKDTFLYSCAISILSENNKDNIDQYCTKLPNGDARMQIRLMLRFLFGILGPSLFFETKHLVSLGGFDDKFKMQEDGPIVMKYLTNGFNIKTIYEPLVQWREHHESVSHTASEANSIFQKNMKESIQYYTLHYCWRYGLLLHQYYYWIEYWIEAHQNSGNFYKFLGYFLRCFDIVRLYRKIKPCSDRTLQPLDKSSSQ